MWVQLCFVHRGAGRDMTIEGAQWSQSFQISNQSLVRFSSWNTGSWDDHNWRVRFLTGAQFLYNPGPTHIQSDISYCPIWGRQLQLLFASDFGVWPSAANQVSISIQVWASLVCGGSQVWVMWERGPCWCTLTVLNLPGCRQQAVRTEVVPNPFWVSID